MKLFSMLLNDPLVLYSTIGLAMLFAIGGYYVYYFIKHIQEDEKQ